MVALAKVAAGDQIKAADHNSLVDEINTKATPAQVTSTVETKISALVGSAPETLDTLEEIATALTSNQEVIETLNSAIGSKADKTTVATLTTEVGKKANASDLVAINNALKTSDQFKSVAINGTSMVFTFKDNTTKSVALPITSAVYG